MNAPECPIRFAVVDDDENDRWMIIRVVEKAGEFVCVGSCRSANEALTEIPKIRPDLVLMDIRMPGMDGIECTRRLKVVLMRLKIVVITALQDLESVNNSLRAGADGYLTKPVNPAECLAALSLAMRTRAPCRNELNPFRFRGRRACVGNPLLTDRENEVMALIAKGLPFKEVAGHLGISYSAVHKHQHNSFRKLGASNRTEALNKWWQTLAETRSYLMDWKGFVQNNFRQGGAVETKRTLTLTLSRRTGEGTA